MATAYLNSYRSAGQQLSSSADGALSAFEHDMFETRAQVKAQEQTNEANPESLSYLFSIFAY